MYSTDVFFTQGLSHTVCQDYATCNKSVVALCDGCSASPDSDFGARHLAQIALSQLSLNGKLEAYQAAKALEHSLLAVPGISTLAGDATLLTAFVCDQGNISCEVHGDGLIVELKNGFVTIYDLDCSSGYPGYLSYFSNEARMRELEEKSKGHTRNIIVSMYPLESLKDMAVAFQAHLDDMGAPYKEETPSALHGAVAGVFGGWKCNFNDPDAVLLFSDGLKTFQIKVGNQQVSVPVPVILYYILKIPGKANGHYLNRRCKRFLNKEVSWRPTDDFSVASLWRAG